MEAHFDDADIGLLAGVIHRNLGYAFYPILDGICDVGDNLFI